MNEIKERKVMAKVDEELYQELKKICKKHDVTVSQIVRAGVKHFLESTKNRR